jgi:hypothetical protein
LCFLKDLSQKCLFVAPFKTVYTLANLSDFFANIM